MKILFFLVCASAGIAFSFLSVIYGTGRIPFREPLQGPQVSRPVATNVVAVTALLPAQETLDQLFKQLKSEQEKFVKKKMELDEKEAELIQQRSIVETLRKDMETLRGQLEDKSVALNSDEQVNLKRLAEIYARMEPASAATLLMEMKAERSARVLRLIGDRQSAAILNETIAQGDRGAKVAAEWSDVIRRMRATEP